MKSNEKEAIALAQNYLLQQPVYLDTETTGTDEYSEIVEICIIDHDGRVLLDSLVKPALPIFPDATRIHGISNLDVQSAPSWIKLWPKVASILNGRTIGIYNADFDLRLMSQSHARYKMKWQSELKQQAFCIMKLYARFHGDWNAYRRSFRWQSLAAAGRQCGIPLSNTHRAKDDTLLAREVLLAMARA